MSQLPPLPEDVRQLIASDLGHAAPPEAERAKVLRGLEVTLGLSLAPALMLAPAPLTTAVSSKVGLGLAAKLSLIAALSGVVAGAWLLRPTQPKAVTAAAQGAALVVSSAPVVSAAAVVIAPPAAGPALAEEAAPEPSDSAPLKAAARISSADNLAEERRLLAGARSALQQHNLGQATALLAEHARRFGAGRLGEERDRLMVQAAVLSGDAGRARAQARAFVQRYPKSVYTPGVTRLLDTLK